MPSVSIPVAIFVILESILLKYKEKNLIKKWKWTIWIIYIFFFAFIFYFNISNIISAKITDMGYGPGIDVPFVLPWKPVFIIRLIVFLLVLIIDAAVVYFLRFKFAENNDFLVKKYWADSLKIIIFFIISFFVIWFIKRGFGRPFYFCIHFKENNIVKLIESIGGSSTNHTLGNFNGYYGENGNILYYPWYQPNNFSLNFQWKYLWMWTPNVNEYMTGNGDGWCNGAFPSGHMAATYSFLVLIFYFVGQDRNRKLNNWKIIIISLLGIYLISMNFNLVIAQTHWLRDTSFIIIYATLILWLINYWVNKKFVFNGK